MKEYFSFQIEGFVEERNNVGLDFYLKRFLINIDKRIEFDYFKLYQLV